MTINVNRYGFILREHIVEKKTKKKNTSSYLQQLLELIVTKMLFRQKLPQHEIPNEY